MQFPSFVHLDWTLQRIYVRCTWSQESPISGNGERGSGSSFIEILNMWSFVFHWGNLTDSFVSMQQNTSLLKWYLKMKTPSMQVGPMVSFDMPYSTSLNSFLSLNMSSKFVPCKGLISSMFPSLASLVVQFKDWAKMLACHTSIYGLKSFE